MEEGKSAFKVLTGKPKGKMSLGRTRLRWEENTIMIIKTYVSMQGIGLIRLRTRVIGDLL